MIKLYKIVSTLFCVAGLTYHVSELFYEYSLGKTIVNVNVQRNRMDHLPSFTICYPNLFSLKKLAQIDDDFKGLYKYYQEKFESYQDSINKTIEAQNELQTIYDLATKLVYKRLSKNTLDLKDMIENFTIDFKNEHGKPLISTYFHGNILNNTIIDPMEDVKDVNSQIFDDPVESIIIGRIFGGERLTHKCFTFFSFLKRNWRNYQTYFYYMLIKITYNYKSIPPSTWNRVHFALHSPNAIPELTYQFYKILFLKNEYFLKYSILKTTLLDKRYDTNCFEYNLDYKHANFNMKSDCITHCYQRRMNEIVNNGVVESYAPSHYLLRKEVIEQVPNIFIELDKFEDQAIKSKVKLSCFKECPRDCRYKYYSMDVERFSSAEDPEQISIYLEHDHMPDISIMHIPEITLLSLVCNLGGLIGMWLGISVMIVFEELYKILILVKNDNFFGRNFRNIFIKNIIKIKIKPKITNKIRNFYFIERRSVIN